MRIPLDNLRALATDLEASEREVARTLGVLAGCDPRTVLGALRVGLHRVRKLSTRARIAKAAAQLGVEVRP